MSILKDFKGFYTKNLLKIRRKKKRKCKYILVRTRVFFSRDSCPSFVNPLLYIVHRSKDVRPVIRLSRYR